MPLSRDGANRENASDTPRAQFLRRMTREADLRLAKFLAILGPKQPRELRLQRRRAKDATAAFLLLYSGKEAPSRG